MSKIDSIKTLVDALPGKSVEISRNIFNEDWYYVEYTDGFGGHTWVKEGLNLTGTIGRGETIEKAALDYIRMIKGKTLIFERNGKREEVKVAFLKEEPDNAGK